LRGKCACSLERLSLQLQPRATTQCCHRRSQRSAAPRRHREYRSQIEEAPWCLASWRSRRDHRVSCRLVRFAGVPFLLDPAPAYPLTEELLRSVTWLTPNETEAQLLLAPSRASTLSLLNPREVVSLGVRNVILKLGARVYICGEDVEALRRRLSVTPSIPRSRRRIHGLSHLPYENRMAPQEAADSPVLWQLVGNRSGAQTSMQVSRVRDFLRGKVTCLAERVGGVHGSGEPERIPAQPRCGNLSAMTVD